MTDLANLDQSLVAATDLEPDELVALLGAGLAGVDDGELFLEYRETESLAFDDGRLKSAAFDASRGFGLRAVAGEAIGYAHSRDLSERALRRAIDAVQPVKRGYAGTPRPAAPGHQSQALWRGQSDPGPRSGDQGRGARADRCLRARQGAAGQAGQRHAQRVVATGRDRAARMAPGAPTSARWSGSTSPSWSATGRRMESGSFGAGGRTGYGDLLEPAKWRSMVDEAVREALTKLESVAAPAGEMVAVLGPGWPGILLHEAIGHGLEGDFNRKKTSAFAGLLGQRVAARGVTVVDDGTLEHRRGSLTIDDEGTPSACNVLIEDGILVGYMQDRQNARLMGQRPTGNGRRQSFAHQPMPRMTNTYMRAGDRDPEEILAGVRSGLYAKTFGGGQVDITSGKFVFTASEAYLIENGRIAAPVKGATLIGNGPDCLTRVRAVGNDLALDRGIGTCGKEGQWVPVGVGQPTLLIEGLTVGGTAPRG